MPDMEPEYKTPLLVAVLFFVVVALIVAMLFAISASGVNVSIAFAELLYPLLGLAGLVAMIAVLVAIGRYILGPLDRAARHGMRPTQFTMVDFLSLIFLFQLPMAALQTLHGPGEERHEAYWYLNLFCWIVIALMWGFSVRTLSRAGIENTWHRGVFLAFVLPAAYFGSIVFLISIFVAVVALWMEGLPSTNGALIVSAVVAGLLAAFFLSAKFVRKMVAARASTEEYSRPRDDGK
jgi:hypothetical protein